jgi:hypothetical protein
LERTYAKKILVATTLGSIGLKSGEYGDKEIILAPTDSIIGLIDANLWAGKLGSIPVL